MLRQATPRATQRRPSSTNWSGNRRRCTIPRTPQIASLPLRVDTAEHAAFDVEYVIGGVALAENGHSSCVLDGGERNRTRLEQVPHTPRSAVLLGLHPRKLPGK